VLLPTLRTEQVLAETGIILEEEVTTVPVGGMG